jgi:hypothetical protein
MYEEARRAGLGEIITHIHESNTAACGWAERTGWQSYGTITRYHADVPGLRNRGFFLHRTSQQGRKAASHAGNTVEVRP